jgi:hypothetical protein
MDTDNANREYIEEEKEDVFPVRKLLPIRRPYDPNYVHEDQDSMPGFERPLAFGYDPPPEEWMDWNKDDPTQEHNNDECQTKHQVTICGLRFGTDGRSCEKHNICGDHVVVGNILRQKYSKILLPCGRLQTRLAVYLMDGKRESCRVGFVCPAYFSSEGTHWRMHSMRSFVVDIQVVRLWKTNYLRADMLHGGAADCIWIDVAKPKMLPVVTNK